MSEVIRNATFGDLKVHDEVFTVARDPEVVGQYIYTVLSEPVHHKADGEVVFKVKYVDGSVEWRVAKASQSLSRRVCVVRA